MSPRSTNQGRLPESLSLSVGLHALLLLIPLGALIRSEGEVEGRTRVTLVDLSSQDFSSGEAWKNTLETDDLLNEDAEFLEALEEAPLNESGAGASIEDQGDQDASTASPPGDPTESTPLEKDSPSPALDSTNQPQEAKDGADSTPPEAPQEDLELVETENQSTDPPQTQLDSLTPPSQTTLLQSTTEPEPPDPTEIASVENEEEQEEEEQEEEEDKEDPVSPREFARAPSRGPEAVSPPSTSRISDQNMSVDEELRASVHSTEEGSAELGTKGSTASSGRPAPPGSQPAGRRGQSGENEQEGRDFETDAAGHSSAIGSSTHHEPTPPVASSESLLQDSVSTPGSAVQTPEPGSHGGQSPSSASPGQEGYRTPQAEDGDIAALLAARRGTSGQTGARSRSRAGSPYRPSLAMPGTDRNGVAPSSDLPGGANSTTSPSSQAVGDGLAEAGDQDGLHPEASEYRKGAPSGGASIASPGAADRSATAPLTVADLSIRLGDVTRLNARATPLGVYISIIEDEIREAWVLPVEYRAMGTQGVAEVSFVVSRNGRVSQATIIRKSGTEGLDRLALQSIPRWLPRIPTEIDRRHIRFSYVFRATDSIVSDTTDGQ